MSKARPSRRGSNPYCAILRQDFSHGEPGSSVELAGLEEPCENLRMIFSFFRRRRRKALLALPFPTEWVQWLLELPFYQGLDEEERESDRLVFLPSFET